MARLRDKVKFTEEVSININLEGKDWREYTWAVEAQIKEITAQLFTKAQREYEESFRAGV